MLRDQGHEVTVAAGKPNYPDGAIFPGYRAGGTQREIYDSNIEVVRVPLRPRGKGGAKNLLLNYLSFVLAGTFLFPWLLRGKKFDAIVVFAASPNVALPALPLRWIKNAHLALWIQDLWPESLSATGFIKSPFLLRVVGWVVRFTYACADTILVQSRGFVAPVAKYCRREKIVHQPNAQFYADADPAARSTLPAALVATMQDFFCVSFTGNLGTAQAMETVIAAAQLLQDLPEVKIVLVGSGSMSEWLAAKVTELNLTNVVLAGRFPDKAMPEIYHYSQALLITLKDEEIFSYVIPTKAVTYLAAGKPIISAVNGEVAKLIRESKSGLTCVAENPRELAELVRKMVALSAEERKSMGAAGRACYLENFEIRRQAERMVESLRKRIGETGFPR